MLDILVAMQRRIALGCCPQEVNTQWGAHTHACMHTHAYAHKYCVQGTALGFEGRVGVLYEGKGPYMSSYEQWEEALKFLS